MKIFLSWSGERSKAVAELLNEWLRCVIQAARPWISTRDVDRGALWFGEISDQLKETAIGIVCLTQENKEKPWVLFEAGALAKGLSSSRVCTLLIDLEPKDVRDPLAQFNHTFATEESMHALCRTLNSAMTDNSLDERILDQVFRTYWPQFKDRFERILKETKSKPAAEPRPEADILAEILESTRALSAKIRYLEGSNRSISTETAIRMQSAEPMSEDKIRWQIRSFLRRGMPKGMVFERMKGKADSQFIISTIERQDEILKAKGDAE